MNPNIQFIQEQIACKINYNQPYYAIPSETKMVKTDMDHFPYKRFFRGVYYKDIPVIMEREAGFQPLNNACYTQRSNIAIDKHNFCWEYPCSFKKPCKGKKDEQKGCSEEFVISP